MDSESRSDSRRIVVNLLLKTDLVPDMESLEWQVGVRQRLSLTESVGNLRIGKLMVDVVGQCCMKIR